MRYWLLWLRDENKYVLDEKGLPRRFYSKEEVILYTIKYNIKHFIINEPRI